jgi:hypothetical protein
MAQGRLRQALCFEVGLNCYVETHIDRLSEVRGIGGTVL